MTADDEPQIRELLAEILAHLGYLARLAGDGEEALHQLRRESFDGTFPLKVPKLGRLVPLRTSKRFNPALPVIMMPGYPGVGIAVEAMQEGAMDFITKPLRIDELKLAAYASAATSVVHSKPASPLQ